MLNNVTILTIRLNHTDSKVIALQLKSGGDATVPFKAVLTSLTPDDLKTLEWDLLKQKDEQEGAEFRIKRAFDMKMIGINRPESCLEIQVTQVGDTELFLQDVCVKVRETIERKLKDKCPEEQYFLAFVCTCHQTSDTHMMEVDVSTSPYYTHAVCRHAPLDQKLEDTHLFWFVSPD